MKWYNQQILTAALFIFLICCTLWLVRLVVSPSNADLERERERERDRELTKQQNDNDITELRAYDAWKRKHTDDNLSEDEWKDLYHLGLLDKY